MVLRGIFGIVLIFFGVFIFYETATADPTPWSDSECISMAQRERWSVAQQCYDDFGEDFMCQLQGNKRGEYLPAKCLKYFKS